MRKNLFVGMAILAFLFISSSLVYADTEGSAIADAGVRVVPNITVDQSPQGAHMGDIQTGEFCGTFGFRVDSNLQYVDIQICASDLYKGGEPTSLEIIPVHDPSGAVVDPDCAQPQTLPYETDTTLNSLDASQFAFATFESGQDSHFSCDVDGTVCWDQIDPELPEGDYEGFVKLYAVITP